MKTQNTEELTLAKGFSRSAKEKIMKDILSKLLTPNNSLSTDRDTDILRMILIEDKKLKEAGAKFNLTPTRISELFYRAIKRVNLRLASFTEQLENSIDMQEEINFLKSKLLHYEKKENQFFTLPSATREILFKDIEEFNLSARVVNICKHNDIDTLADLVKLSKWDFAKMRNAGKGTVREVNEFLTSKGLTWKMKV